MATTTAPVQIISTEPEYHPEVTTKGTAHAVKSATKGKATPAKPAVMTPADIDAAAAKLRTRYVAADKGESEARVRFEAADIDWQNARVIKVRVAYAAAMLTPNKGEANLLAASRFLLTTPDEFPTAGKRTAAAKSRKNTLRNYVAAGEALQEAGLIAPDRITEPDENERKIVAAVFREMNKRDKEEAKGDTPEGETKGEAEGDTPEGDEPLTIVDIVGHIARMTKTLDLMAASGIVISEREASNVADMLAGFTAKLEEYAADK